MKVSKASHRRFLLASLLFAPLAAVADAKWFEPQWVRLRPIGLGADYPARIEKLAGTRIDLVLAGHSHGRPGPLYVNPGIGWYPFPIRLNCRPEITVFEV